MMVSDTGKRREAEENTGSSCARMLPGEEERELAYRLFSFIGASPTSFHAAAAVAGRLREAGFARLEEGEEFPLSRGGRYMAVRNDSSVIAFVLPEKELRGFRITASHLDSPCFKVKQTPEIEVEGRYIKLNTEPYGGMLLSTWLDRPLSVAGRVVVEAGGRLESRLVNMDRDMLVIPNVAVHLNREAGKGMEYQVQTDLLPLYRGMEDREGFLSLVAGEAGVAREALLDYDLFVYNRDPGRLVGAGEEFLLSPRLDDLQCVYATLEGFLQAGGEDDGYARVFAAFDNEETGSRSRQGADSPFLGDVLARIGGVYGADHARLSGLLENSFLISADNAHAVHPNHPEKSDPTNRPFLNGGIVIKYQAGQRYTTDGRSGARMKSVCRRAEVPFQTYANRSDIPGGSTLGNLCVSHLAVPAVDIGLAQLAMHSACETAGAKDTGYLIRAARVFYEEG